MKVLLVDWDSKIPNLALMKLSAWHKNKGDETILIRKNDKVPSFDKAYISCIFPQNRLDALTSYNAWKEVFCYDVEIGGSAISYENNLSDEIEHICPDYDLYHTNYSMGYTSRGCFRNCEWCIVPKKEGRLRDHAPLSEFLRHDKLILLDNCFNASPKFEENSEELIRKKVKVCFTQGLDIRRVDKKQAETLSRIEAFDHKFKTRSLYFSFDEPENKEDVIRGIENLKKGGVKPKEMLFYMLCGFNTTFDEDFERFKLLRELGTIPYVMVYNNRKDIKILKHFQRFVIRKYYEMFDWEKYDDGDSQIHIKKWLGEKNR